MEISWKAKHFPPFTFTEKETEEIFLSFYGEQVYREMTNILPTPPKKTSIRVNTLNITTKGLLSLLKKHFLESTGQDLEIYESKDLADVLEIPSYGPFDVSPSEFKLLIGEGAAESVLRGASVFSVNTPTHPLFFLTLKFL